MSRPTLRRCACVVAAIAAVWGGVLPALLRCGPIARHVARMEETGTNASAMYYTELERVPVRPGWLDDHLALWP